MPKLSHSKTTVGSLLRQVARRLQRAQLYFGHGTDNATDEAATLIWHALGLDWQAPANIYSRAVSVAGQARVLGLVQQRISQRVPAVYLTGTTWFAGLPMRTDARALVPRSPLAELIETQFAPWIAVQDARRVLDLCTGSGCIAIACAKYLPHATVDATDISGPALQLARENVALHRLRGRVRCLKSDYFSALKGRRYDIIVSNPPYVSAREMKSLPAEYRHEPSLALAAGRDGLDAVRAILRVAAAHLNPGGILVVEVGNSESAVRRRFGQLPFTWLAFEHGGDGVFLLTAAQLVRYAPAIAAELGHKADVG